MWKLVLTECRYHWLPISIAYALIVFLGISYLLFEGATWQIISTTSSTILILPTLALINSLNREKRYRNMLPLPLGLKTISMARLLSPIAVASVGLAIPWLFLLLFSPGSADLVMAGRTLLVLGFLITLSTTYPLILDLKHLFRGRHGKAKYIASFILLKLFLIVMFGSVYLLQYPHIHRAANLQLLELQMNSYPGVLIYGAGFIITGILIFTADVLVFQRRLTFVE